MTVLLGSFTCDNLKGVQNDIVLWLKGYGIVYLTVRDSSGREMYEVVEYGKKISRYKINRKLVNLYQRVIKIHPGSVDEENKINFTISMSVQSTPLPKELRERIKEYFSKERDTLREIENLSRVESFEGSNPHEEYLTLTSETTVYVYKLYKSICHSPELLGSLPIGDYSNEAVEKICNEKLEVRDSNCLSVLMNRLDNLTNLLENED